MVAFPNLILVGVAVASAAFRAYLKPIWGYAGVLRTVEGFNNDRCHAVHELQGCEDMYLHRESGIAYLPCTPPESRAFWTPALLKLNRSAVSWPSRDRIYLFDTKTEQTTPLELEGLPARTVSTGLHLHGIDLFVDGDSATIFAINHRPPLNHDVAPQVGADSVVEVFETKLGASTAKWVGTVQHEAILTPNNLVAMGPRSFYVTNDHAEKTEWLRHIEVLWDRPGADIVYCTAESGFASPSCRSVSGQFPHPNGIAKGPGSTLWMVTTYKPHLRSFEIQADHSLVLQDQIKLPRLVDNINVSPSGQVYVASFPKPLQLGHFTDAKVVEAGFKDPKTGEQAKVATEVWRVSNSTGEERFHGGKLQVEKVFADNGDKASCSTNALAYNDRIYVTGLSSPWLSVCEVSPEFAS